MRIIFTGLTLILFSPVAVYAQAVSNDMTCDEAVKYYEEHGRIDTNVNNEVLPISDGVPVSKQEELKCEEEDVSEPVFLKSKDKAQCVVAYHCED
jgi:hypothetical protein